MPLRDHFHPPLSDLYSWEPLHGAWPTVIALDLNQRLPSRYIASPKIHLGAEFEIDVAALERESTKSPTNPPSGEGGGLATAVWAPPQPTLTIETDFPEPDEYAVQIRLRNGLLVAAVEIVSPSNKDRPESRRTFVTKCAAMIQQGIAVSIIDLVSARQFNLYDVLLERLGHDDHSRAGSLYAAACRQRHKMGESSRTRRIDTWEHRLEIGKPLPVLPLWLSADFAVPLDLEKTYEQTCRGLRIVEDD